MLDQIRFALAPATRSARAERVIGNDLDRISPALRDLLTQVLETYVMNGEAELGNEKLTSLILARYGRLSDARPMLGPIPEVRQAYTQMQVDLYRS